MTNESTTKLNIDISALRKNIQEANRLIRVANSEFKAASAGMDDWAKSADGIDAKLTQLNKVVKSQEKILESLEQQYAAVVEEQGENSKGAQELLIKINNQKAAISKTNKEIQKWEASLEDLKDASKEGADGLDDITDGAKDINKNSPKAAKGVKEIGDEAEDAGKDAGSLGESLKGLAKGAFAGIAAAAAGVATAFLASAEATRELRTNMAKVETAFTSAGFEANTATETYKDFYAVLGDEGQATEAVNHLAKLCDTEKDLTDWTTIATGVYGTFGDSLPIEGLTEAANETAKVGQVTGPLADALNWAGISEDEFNEKLAKCNSEQERAALITSTLKGEYEAAAATYEETAGSIMDAQRAQAELNDALAGVGAVAEPVMSSIKLLGAEMLNSLLPGLEEVGAGITDLVNGVDGASEKVGAGLSNLLTGILDKVVEMLPQAAEIATELMITFVQAIVNMLPTLVSTAGEIIITLITAITKAMPELIPAIVDAVYLIIDSLVNMAPQLMQAGVELFSTLINALVDIIPSLIEQLVALVDDLIYGLIEAMPKLLEGAVTLFSAIIEALPTIIDSLLGELPALITAIVDFLVESLPLLIEAAITLLMAIVDAIPAIIDALVENLPEIISAIISGLIEAIPELLEGAVTLFMALVDAIPEINKELLKAAPEIIAAILEGLGTLGEDLKELFSEAWEGIKGVFKDVGGWFKEKFTDAKDNVEEAWSGAKKWASNTWSNIKSGFKDTASWFGEKFTEAKDNRDKAWEKTKSWASDTWGNIKDGFKDAGSWFGEKFTEAKNNRDEAWSGTKKWASDTWSGIKGKFKDVGGWFGEKFGGAWETIKGKFDDWGEFFGGLWTKIKDKFSDIGENIGGAISDTVKSGINGVLSTIESVINGGISLINGAIDIINKIPGVDIGHIGELSLPRLERGGVLKKGQVGLLEGNGAEAVVPLENNKKWIRKTAKDMTGELQKQGLIASQGSSQSQQVTQNFYQYNTSPKALSRLEIYRQTRNQLNFAKGV